MKLFNLVKDAVNHFKDIAGFKPNIVDAKIPSSFEALTEFIETSDDQNVKEYTKMLKSLAVNDDFSKFVAPWDPLIKSKSELKALKPGVFIAFISVDDPVSGTTMGVRHLTHAMVVLGEGKAAGYDNYRSIGLSNKENEITWEIS